MVEQSTEREYLTVKQFRERHPNLGTNLLYDQIRAGEIPSIRLGGKILIPSDAFDRLVEKQARERSETGEAAEVA